MLTCSCYDYDSDGWYWQDPTEGVLKTKRSRKCCSCGKRVMPGETAVMFPRYRTPLSDVEESIYGDEVPLADWHMCEECGDMFWSLDALGFCIFIGDHSMRELTREYHATYHAKSAGSPVSK